MTIYRTMIFPTILKCSLLILFFVNLPRLVVADSAPNSDQDFSQIEYFGSHSNGDEYFKGEDLSAGHVTARAGTNITIACPGVTPTSYVYLVEWVCLGCKCTKCPNPNGEGKRLLRYNDKLVRWDEGAEDDDSWTRRHLDTKQLYALTFSPVTSDDTGTYLCLMNNRRQPDSPVYLTVEDVPDPPPSRPMAVKLSSRSVDLSWAPPRKIHLHPVTSYRIIIKEGEEGEWNRTVETPTNSTSFTISDLNPFTIYFFKIEAKNLLGYSKPSLESYPTLTHRELPSGRPVFIREKISTSLHGLHLVWRPPPLGSINGEFLGYQLAYRPSNFRSANRTIVYINAKHLNVQNYSLEGLDKHTDYLVTVSAKNLKGFGPEDSIELRTEDGVPLEPLSPRIRNVSSRHLELTWSPPSNAKTLGAELLGYRVYVEELCTADLGGTQNRRRQELCRSIPPETVHGSDTSVAEFGNLAPFTKYRLMVRAFTKRREGPSSEPLIIITDTEPPSSPRITNISCYGVDEILVEWRRPDVYQDRIRFYRIHLESLSGPEFSRDLSVEIMNDTARNLAYIANLTTESRYDLSVSAFVESHTRPGIFYQSESSPIQRVSLGRKCDPLRAFSTKAQEQYELDAGILAGIISTVSVLLLVVLVVLICRRHKPRPRYEFMALTHVRASPLLAGGGNGRRKGRGWGGDPETDIPALSFPKHVSGLHSGDDLAFNKDFETIHSVRSRMIKNGTSKNGAASGSAATTFPDILNGGGNAECVNSRTPIYIDGWMNSASFACLLCESPFTLDSTWKIIWEQDVVLIVTLLTSVAKDDLSNLSEEKDFGDVTVSLHNEDILPEYTIRTMKICRRKSRKGERFVTQLVFPRWPEGGLPIGADFLHFVKAALSCRQSTSEGKVLIHSRNGLDSCLLYATFETMLEELRCRREINVSNYSRHLASVHDLALTSVDQYIYVHDTLAAAVECGHLHSLIHSTNNDSFSGL